MHTFLSVMSEMLTKFYKYKRFLMNLGVMNIPLAEFIFNLQHNREKYQEQIYPGKQLNEGMIATILSYIPYSTSYKAIGVSKKFKDGFKSSTDLLLSEIYKEIFFIKLQLDEKLEKKLPFVFEHSIFSPYFFMLDEILSSDYFFSKEQLNDIKSIKIETQTSTIISKVVLSLLNEKVDKKVMPTGEIKHLYLDKLKNLILNGNFLKQVKSLNKLDFPIAKLTLLYEDIDGLLSLDKIEETKKMNKGLAQLLNWIIFIFKLNKIINPFDFISSNYITNRLDKADLDIIKYFCEVINYLKYNLKFKFKFCKAFEFEKHFELLKTFLKNQKLPFEPYFTEKSDKYQKITQIYFETKEKIPIGALPAYFDRIQIESLKIDTEFQNSANYRDDAAVNFDQKAKLNKQLIALQEEDELGTIKEENSLVLDNNNNKQGAKGNFQEKEAGLSNKPAKIKIMNHYSYNECKGSFLDIPNDILIKQILFFLDINQLPKLGSICKKANECVKTHMFIRIYYLNKEKKIIEQENETTIKSIEIKRQEFFDEYEIQRPSKENALSYFRQISYSVSL